MELGRVTLWPLYTSSNATDSLNFPPADYGFSSSTNGGEVVHNITLKAEDSPHIIKRSIFLRFVISSIYSIQPYFSQEIVSALRPYAIDLSNDFAQPSFLFRLYRDLD